MRTADECIVPKFIQIAADGPVTVTDKRIIRYFMTIVETGLRPGEKLYEELLIASRDIEKTESDQIFVERQPAVTAEELEKKLAILAAALEKNDPTVIRGALHQVVPTFHEPEELNREQGKEVRIPEQERAGKVLAFRRRAQ